jgi:hypothetical protein
VNIPPVAVWLVRPGSPEAVRGTLSLERHAVTFAPEDGDEVFPIPTNRIRRAHRRRGSPILEVTYTDARAEPATVFVYFAEPPPLPHSGGGGLLRPTRGLQRTAAAMNLRARARELRARIDAWVREIADAAGLR